MSAASAPPPLRIRALRVDVPAVAFVAAVRWWADALGGTPVRPDDRSAHLEGVRSRVGVRVHRMDDGPRGLHLDLAAAEIDSAVVRLAGLGAEVVHAGDGDVVMRDPAGLPFRVVGDAGGETLADDRDRLHLRVLLLDVPAADVDAEVAFWAAALAVDPHREEAYPDYTALVPAPGWSGPTNLYVQAIHDGAARMHVDLHAPDEEVRDEALERLLERGAEEVGRFERWATVRTPGGALACLVPDEVG